MSGDVIRLKTLDGESIEFVDEMIGQGGMKDVYLSPGRDYVVCWFRQPVDSVGRDRLASLVGKYRDGIYGQAGGDYWQTLYCWPTAIVEDGGRIGIVAPTYPGQFFFETGSINSDMLQIKGKEKNGMWFATQKHLLDPIERGDWSSYFSISLLISRAVRRMHAAGLAHSDLSFNNVLVDPRGKGACIIDIDGLVVPGKYPPDVLGTPGFIAPEVYESHDAPPGDPSRVLPSRMTDCHALAVMIYSYLLFRHPLDGRMICDLDDPARDERLRMGSHALFIEHPTDHRNRPNQAWIEENTAPAKRADRLKWGDPSVLPYTILGPYLSPLVEASFVSRLKEPRGRPSANDWETALVRTWDLVLKCANASCEEGYFVYDNSRRPTCPFCKTPYGRSIPILDFYSDRGGGKYRPDNHRLVAFDGQYLYHWHTNARVFPNERATDAQKRPVAYISWHNGQWKLVNQSLPGLQTLADRKPIPQGTAHVLRTGDQLLLEQGDGGRVANVTIAQ